jgi:hypothetical protein
VVKVKHIFIGEGKILPPNINSPIENLDEGAFTVTFFNN